MFIFIPFYFSFLLKQAKAFATSHVMQTMGDDFNYQNSHMNFKNLDKLIQYVNARVCYKCILYVHIGLPMSSRWLLQENGLASLYQMLYYILH
jgi:hypothetical protein